MTRPDWYGDWLNRLGMDDPPPVTVDGLQRVQRAHLQQIPFENLDPLLGKIPCLHLEALAAKILHNKRGGYCFELNGLLAEGLSASGFDIRLHLARVMWRRTVPGPETHCLLSVTLDGERYLVDAGFGGPGPLSPISFSTRSGHFPDSAGYVLSDAGELGTTLSRQEKSGELQPLYVFSETRASPEKLAVGNHLAATSKESPFTQRLVLSRVTEDQRVAMENSRLIHRSLAGDILSNRLLTTEQAVRQLGDGFGLHLPVEDTEEITAWLAAR